MTSSLFLNDKDQHKIYGNNKRRKEFFAGIVQIKFEGHATDNPLVYR